MYCGRIFKLENYVKEAIKCIKFYIFLGVNTIVNWERVIIYKIINLLLIRKGLLFLKFNKISSFQKKLSIKHHFLYMLGFCPFYKLFKSVFFLTLHVSSLTHKYVLSSKKMSEQPCISVLLFKKYIVIQCARKILLNFMDRYESVRCVPESFIFECSHFLKCIQNLTVKNDV